jgi:hypothetical protein
MKIIKVAPKAASFFQVVMEDVYSPCIPKNELLLFESCRRSDWIFLEMAGGV